MVPTILIRGNKKFFYCLQVDAHNVVPCWEASDKQEYSARTIRNKITSKLGEYLTEFPPVIKHPYTSKFEPEVSIDLASIALFSADWKT